MSTNAIVPGSLAAVANRDGLSLAESFLNCEILVVIDQSGSMWAKDVSGGRTRLGAAETELSRIQKQNPGKVGVISFSSTVEFSPGGLPNREGGSTNMAGALNFVHVADGACQIVLISDGEPDNESTALVAARRFANPIHTIYIGPESGEGRQFLERLAAMTGGRSFQRVEASLLAGGVEQLLLNA